MLTCESTMLTAQRLTVSPVNSDAGFGALGGDWRRLSLASPRPVPFLTWEWISTWWKHFREDSRLFVLVARDGGGDVVGLAPLRIALRRGFGVVPVRTVEFLGYRGSAVCADHLDFLTAPEERGTIVETLVSAVLARRDEWDALVLADLAEDSPVAEALVRLGREHGLECAEGGETVCPYVSLGADWDDFLSGMKKKRRSFVKTRRERLAGACRVRFEWENPAAELHQNLDMVARLHALSRERKGERGNFRREDYLRFHHELVERMAAGGYLYLVRLICDERTVATEYGFRVGDVLFDYQKGYDTAYAPLGVGSVLQGMMLQDAVERLHVCEVDLLRGAEAYKYFWTARERRLRTLLAWHNDFAGGVGRIEFALRRRVARWRGRTRAAGQTETRCSNGD